MYTFIKRRTCHERGVTSQGIKNCFLKSFPLLAVCGCPLLFAGWSTGCFGGCMMPSLPVSGVSVSAHLSCTIKRNVQINLCFYIIFKLLSKANI